MTQKQNLKTTLIFGLFFISLGGWLLHLRIHPPSVDSIHYIPFFIGLVNFAIIPWLFFFRPAINWAYILNGMSVIIGIILMADFSLDKLPPDFAISTLILNTTLADIVLLAGKFTLGKALFDLEFSQLDREPATAGPRAIVQRTMRSELHALSKFLRYPNIGWWLVHLVVMAVVYAIGAELL